jgi:hypothetical protein
MLDGLGFRIAKSVSRLCLIRIQISEKFFFYVQVKIDFDSHVRSLNENSCAHEAQINFGDLTPYLTYDLQGQKTV